MKRLILLITLLTALAAADEPYRGSTLNGSFMWEPTCYHLGFDAPLGNEEHLGWIAALGYCDLFEGKSRFLRETFALGGGVLYAHGGIFRDGLFVAATLQMQQSDVYEVNTYAKGVAYGQISTLWSGYRWHFKRGGSVALGLHFSHILPWRSFIDTHGSRSRDALERMLEREETHWRPLLAIGWRF